MQILITGGNGQLGSSFRDLLTGSQHAFWAPGRTDLDITSSQSVAAAIVKGETPIGKPSAVIHGAAMTQVDLCETEVDAAYRINATASGEIARCCELAGIPVVYVSTDFVFDGGASAPYEPSHPTSPLSVYGASKLAGEVAVRNATDGAYVVRTSWVYSEHGANFPKSILRGAAAGRPLRIVTDQVGSPTYARDLADAILGLLGLGLSAEGVQSIGPVSAAPFATYHVSNSGVCSWHSFGSALLAEAGWEVQVGTMSSSELDRPARRPGYSVLSQASVLNAGLRMRSWQEALTAFMPRARALAPELFPTQSA